MFLLQEEEKSVFLVDAIEAEGKEKDRLDHYVAANGFIELEEAIQSFLGSIERLKSLREKAKKAQKLKKACIKKEGKQSLVLMKLHRQKAKKARIQREELSRLAKSLAFTHGLNPHQSVTDTLIEWGKRR